MKKLLRAPEDVRVNEDVTDRPILMPEAGLVVEQRFATRETKEDVVDGRRIDVEFGDIVPDVFVARVAEKVQFGLIGPQNRAVRAHPVQPFSGVIETRLELSIDALGDFMFQ